MRLRSTRWKIYESEDGEFTLYDKKKIVKRNVSLDEAVRFIRKNKENGDEVAHIEPDGYAFDMTRRFNRKR